MTHDLTHNDGMSHVEDTSITVTLSGGEQHTLTAHRPGPQGGNPRFEEWRA